MRTILRLNYEFCFSVHAQYMHDENGSITSFKICLTLEGMVSMFALHSIEHVNDKRRDLQTFRSQQHRREGKKSPPIAYTLQGIIRCMVCVFPEKNRVLVGLDKEGVLLGQSLE